MSEGPHQLEVNDVDAWARASGRLDTYTGTLSADEQDYEVMSRVHGLPLHVAFAFRKLVTEDPDVTIDRLASIPFYSLCKGFFLPLSGMAPEKAAHVLGLVTAAPLDTAGREALLATFFARDLGLGLVSKLSCVLGDPFRGRGSSVKRDSLVHLLLSMEFVTRRQVLDRLANVGDVAVLFADWAPAGRAAGEPLTAAEVLETLRFLPTERGERRFDVLRSLYERCGKLEAYFLTKLVLRKAGLGFEYEGPLLARVIGAQFGVAAEHVSHAMALTDPFRVVDTLAKNGADGLRAIQLQPLSAVRPALASGGVEALTYPTWVERKFDGIRFMLHKATDASGAIQCGAYTRNRRDWLDLAAGLRPSIQLLPCQNAIVDGELYGMIIDGDGLRPATVYEVFQSLQGERMRPINLKFAAFDLVYLNGQDLTRLPLSERRARLQWLLAPLQSYPTPVPITLAEGQLAQSKDDVNRLYNHFRSQGYEGIITKDLRGAYHLAERDPAWRKRKPEETLDLVLLAGVFAVTEKTNTALFGSFAIGALARDGGFVDVGDVAGVDRATDNELQATIVREGLITGRRVERASASGVRAGLELRPFIVVTVRFEGIVKDPATGAVKLRDPKLVAVRSDKGPTEIDGVRDMEAIELRHRVG